MTISDDPDQIRADIEQTRARLSADVDTLGETANPKNIANRQVDKVKGAARGVRDTIMGSPDDPYDDGRLGDARARAGDQVAQARDAVGDAVSNAPAAAKQKTRGNPLAAGLIAFGAGLLISSLIPATQREQRAVSDLQENLEPLKEHASGVAKEMAENLRAPAEEAIASVRSTATEAVQNVKDEGQQAKDQVQDQAAESKANVQQAQSDSSSGSAADRS